MKKKKAWVWFKGSLKEGEWVSGFFASDAEGGGILLESPNFVTCRVPKWRVVFDEPNDLNQGPSIPPEAEWKYP